MSWRRFRSGVLFASLSLAGCARPPSTETPAPLPERSAPEPSAAVPATTAAAPAGEASKPALQLRTDAWTQIAPDKLDYDATFGITCIEIDPVDPLTLYICVDERGLWKSQDGGATWRRLGSGVPEKEQLTTRYLDSPMYVEVDPRNRARIYATQGVRGAMLGFWISEDAGETWKRPEAFEAVARETTDDVTTLTVDPSNFDHFLLGSHSPWKGLKNAGFFESKDGGKTWIRHKPRPEWSVGSVSLTFLFEPSLRVGSAQTWLLGDQVAGFWRTGDAGKTWKRVHGAVITHGGGDHYYSRTGALYVGAEPQPLRSTDNGATFQPITSLPPAHYYSLQGDGTTLYTQLAFTGDNNGFGLQPYMVSAENDGVTWAPQSTQRFKNGPFVMRFDASRGVLYSANWAGGLWALKVQSAPATAGGGK